jgi:dTDP-4-amino-4,6-dideoxygalactose transaminase
MEPKIPFNKPFIAGRELEYIEQAVKLGNIGADGVFTRKCEEILERRFGVGKAMMTPSCSAALEMAALLCGAGPGDEVILPSYTFVSTANAIVRTGAKPVFVDICEDTLNLNPELVEDAVTPRTKAIFAVHYAGVACDMSRISEIAQRRELLVVEDAAQGVNAFYQRRALGSIGALGAYSFHETKNYMCGEGGALCINSPQWIERAEIIHDKGTNRRQFFRGEVDKYTWVDVGSGYAPSEIVCAFLYGQLELLDEIAQRRRSIHQLYRQQLAPLEAEGLLRTPHVPEDCESNHHMFYIVLPDAATRNTLLERLQEQDIRAVFHYVPLHTSPMGRKFGYQPGDLPVTEDLSARLLRLPFFYEMTEEQQSRVANAVADCLRGSRKSAMSRGAAPMIDPPS